MNIDYNAFEGMNVKGFTETVLSRGKIILNKGYYIGRPGDGMFIKRGPYGGAYAPVAEKNRIDLPRLDSAAE
jgi:hypothetical protein